MTVENNVKVAAFFRPRGFFILLAGGVSSVMAAAIINWWMLLIGIIVTCSAYGWSVSQSLHDRKFIEQMSSKGLSADVSPLARLEVLAHTGSRHLAGSYRENVKAIASTGLQVIRSISAAPGELAVHVQDVPEKVSSIVVLYEKMAIEHSTLSSSGEGSTVSDDSKRCALLDEAMEKAMGTVTELKGKCDRISGQNGAPNALLELSSSLGEHMSAIENVASELKLLE